MYTCILYISSKKPFVHHVLLVSKSASPKTEKFHNMCIFHSLKIHTNTTDSHLRTKTLADKHFENDTIGIQCELKKEVTVLTMAV